MPWRPLPRIAVAVAIYPFTAVSPADLPLEIGDDLYIIEQGGKDGAWYRGYLVAPPSLLAGLTSSKGQNLEARVFSGIFPRCCVDVREHLGETGSEGQTIGQVVNGSANKNDGINGSLSQGQSNTMRKPSVRKRKSNDSMEKMNLGHNGAVSAEVNPVKGPIRSLSRQHHNAGNIPGLARQLSRQSITSPRSIDASTLPTRTSDPPRDEDGKRPQAPVPMLKIGDETPTSISEPLIDEIASCLREWHSNNLHELLLTRNYAVLDQLSNLVTRLDTARRQLLHGVLTAQELAVIREETVWNLVGGNKLLGNEVIVRNPKSNGRLLTGDDSAFEMARLQSSMSVLERPPVLHTDVIGSHHLMVELKGFAANGLLSPSICLYICSKNQGEPMKILTESYIIDLPTSDTFEIPPADLLYKTMFANFGPNEVGETADPLTEIYLVVNVYASLPIEQSRVDSRNNSVAGESGARPSTGSSTSSPAKSGRQSLMWASKQFGSVRNRSQAGLRPGIYQTANSHANALEDKTKPTTHDIQRPSPQAGIQYVRRKVGIGLHNLKTAFAYPNVSSQHLTIWTSTTGLANGQHPTDGYWESLMGEMISGKNRLITKVKAVDHVKLGLHSFVHADSQDLVNKPSLAINNITFTPRTDLSGTPDTPRSDIYIKLSETTLPANSLLSHPDLNTTPCPPTIDLTNIQLTLEVRTRAGDRIENCIVPNANSPPQTAWRTSAVVNGEAWHHMIRLSVPTTDVPEAHLIMSIADAPNFPFALCWMPLWIDDAFIKDGVHAPLLYLYDKITSGHVNGRGAYLDFPWSSQGELGHEHGESLKGPTASLKIETKLCSTDFSQDSTLLGILNWRQQSKARTLGFLKRFSYIPEIEVAKLIRQVLDSLFSILVNGAEDEDYEDSVFGALVITLGVVHDRRFNLGPFVDKYAEDEYEHPYAAPCLLRAYTRLLSDRHNMQKQRAVRATFKVGRHIMKFILRARVKQHVKEAEIGATMHSAFKTDLAQVFKSFQDWIHDPAPALIGSKTLIVQYMPSWLPELKILLSEAEIFKLASTFVDACNDVQGKLILYKLLLVIKLGDSGLFKDEDVRRRVIQYTPQWTEMNWGTTTNVTMQWREQVRMCCSVVYSQADKPGFDWSQYVGKVTTSYLCLLASPLSEHDGLSLLFPATYPFPLKKAPVKEPFDEALVELGSLLARFSNLPSTFESHTNRQVIADEVSAILRMIESIMSGGAFPKSWLSLYVWHHKHLLTILESVFNVMSARLLPLPEDADNFDTELWSKYLSTLLCLVRSDTLALETFPEQKRRAVWKIAGDVREQGSILLNQSWSAIGWDTDAEEQKRYGLARLGGYQVQYVPALIAPIVELCLSVHEGLRGVAIRILQAMIISEWTLNEDLSVVQAEMIDSLDAIFKTKDVSDSLVHKMFVNELLDAFEYLARMPLDPLWQAIRDVVATMDELLELLVAVHGHNTDESMRVTDTLQLMNFLKDMQKEDIFIRYVHQLADTQSRSGNKTQAGLALQLHADQYTWDHIAVRKLEEPAFAEESSFERKERLYFEMIKFFEDGAAWDCALSSYRELASQYELVQFDFAKLARTQRAMATIYETIAKGEILPPRYFRVIYRGLGFPPALQDRQFVYEGDPSERQQAFADRLRQLHPSAQVLGKDEPEDLEGQYLQITPVSIYRDLERPIYQQSKVGQSIREFVSSARPHRFATTSKRHMPASGVQDQWIEKTIFTLKEAFPTILRRSEIMSIETVALTPLQTALERTTRKTAELTVLEKRLLSTDADSYSNLSDAIMTSVDDASAVTIAQYRKLLPDEIEHDEDDDDAENAASITPEPSQVALRIAILDHVSAIKHCLTHFNRTPYFSTHTSLSDRLQHTYGPELEQLQIGKSSVHVPQDSQDLVASPPTSSGGLSADLASQKHMSDLASRPAEVPPPLLSTGSETRNRLSFGKFKTPVLTKPNGITPSSAKTFQLPQQPPSTTPTIDRKASPQVAPPNPLSTPAMSRLIAPEPTFVSPLVGMSSKAARLTGESIPVLQNGPMAPLTPETSRMKKRLSLLGGLGRMGSRREGHKMPAMGVVGEE